MLDNPRARLFEFEDHWGEFEDYHFLRSQLEGICFGLIKLGARVKSVFTFGKCVRLFQNARCVGWSLAVYPGSSNSHRMKLPQHVTFQGIGPCLENEFSGSFLNESMPGFVAKNPEMKTFQPDLMQLFDLHINRNTHVFGKYMVQYLLGPGNRTEIIKAGFVQSFGLLPKPKGRKTDFHKSLEGEEGDVLGHAIPTAIGGPPNESFNIFPANQSALKKWEDVVLRFSNNIKQIDLIFLQFEYENENKTRPLSFYYMIAFIENRSVIENRSYYSFYDRIINGYEPNRRRDKPFIEVIPKFEYKGTRTINLKLFLERYSGIFKIKDSFSSNTSIQNFGKNSDIPLINWQSCKSTNPINDTELKESRTQSFFTNITAEIQGMIQNPMVRLFSGENLTGASEKIHSGRARQQFNIYASCTGTTTAANVKSAETFGKCVRLFDKRDCLGLSLAIYAGNSHQTIGTVLNQVQSIGPCLENEFINATFTKDIQGRIVKDRNSSSYFPDLVQFGGFTPDKYMVFRRNGFSHIFYLLGPKNRIEIIRTEVIQFGHAMIPKRENVEEMDYYKSLDKKEGDVPCYAIPLELNGPANESFNIFPISQSKVEDWIRIFPSNSDINEQLFFGVELYLGVWKERQQ